MSDQNFNPEKPLAAGSQPAQQAQTGGYQQGQPSGQISAPEPSGFDVKRSAGRVIGYSILSLGLYTIYWFYVNRKQVTQTLGTSDNATLQTVMIVIPGVNLVAVPVVSYWLWRDINEMRKIGGIEEFSVGGYVVAYIAVNFLTGLGFIIQIMVLDKLNSAWDAVSGGQATDAPSTTGEKLVIVAGIVLWVLGIATIALIAGIAASS